MQLQVQIIKFLQSFSNPLLDVFFIAVTNLGSSFFYYLIVPYLYWNVSKRAAIILISSVLSSMYINTTIKELVALQRPIGYPGIKNLFVESAPGFSFPSGHAQGAATFWTTLVKLYSNPTLCKVGALVVILVSISRVYLGVHWPLDVIAGIAVGTVLALAALPIFQCYKPDMPINVFAAAILYIIMAWFSLHQDNILYSGILLGCWVGYNLEERFVGYAICKNLHFALIKYILGVAGFLALYVIFSFLPHLSFCIFIKYAILGLWLTLGAPFLFNFLHL